MSLKVTYSRSPIIPAILTTSPQDFTNKLDFARTIGAVHLDVIDGQFCPGEALPVAKWPDLNIEYAEAHLMVIDPIKYLADVAAKGVTRAIVHIEAKFDFTQLQQQAREQDLLLGFAVNPDTDLVELRRFLDTNSYIQIMGVDPGYSGQAMYPQTTMAVSYLRKSSAHRIQLSVDGGVNAETIDQLQAAGANFFVENQAIFYRRPYQDNYEQMLKVIQTKQAP